MAKEMFVTKCMPRIIEPVAGAVSLVAGESGLDIVLSPCGVPVSEVRLVWDFDATPYPKYYIDTWGVASADLGWKARGVNQRSEWYFALSDGEQTCCFGVNTGCNSFCSWVIEDHRITLICDTRNGGDGVELAAPLNIATVVSTQTQPGETVYRTVKRFCRSMCRNPRLPGRPVYGFNNWYSTYGNIDRASVLRDARLCALLASGRAEGAPLPYMVIDDGWQDSRVKLPGGKLAFNGGPFLPTEDFGDMKLLAEDVAALDCLPGIWIRPIQVRPDLLPWMPDSFFLRNQDYARSWGPHGMALDPSVEGVKEYVFGLVRGLADSGYKLIKQDFSCPDFLGGDTPLMSLTRPGWHLSDRTKTNAQVIQELYATIREAANGALVIGCNTYNHLAAGYNEIQRSGCDVSGFRWDVTKRNGVNCLIHRLPQNGTFFSTDADCAVFTDRVPTDKNILFADMIARCDSTLFVSAAPDVLKAADIDKLMGIYNISSQARSEAEPLDWMDKAVPQQILWEGQVYSYDWD